MNLFKLMATISLDNKEYNKNIDNSEKKTSGFAGKLGKFAGGVGKFTGKIAVATGGALATLGGFATSSAMELEASEAKYKTVFNGMTKESDKFISEFQKLTPATKAEARNMASGIQDMLIPMGVAREEATTMTGKFMHVAGALANFNSGTETAESVVGKMTGALTGELSSLKSLGIQLDQDTAKQKAVEMGLASSTKEVSKQAMAQVVLAEVYAQSGDALAAYTEDNLDLKTSLGIMLKSFQDVGAEVGSRFIPLLTEGVNSIKNNFESLKPAFMDVADGFVGIVNNIEGSAGKFRDGVMAIVDNMINGLMSAIPTIINTGLQLAMALVTSILDNLPKLIDVGMTAINNLIRGISQQAPRLIPKIIECVVSMIDTFLNHLPEFIEAGMELIFSVADGLINALPDLIDKIPVIIEKIINVFTNNYPKFIEMGLKLIVKLAEGLIKAIPNLITAIPKIIQSLMQGFGQYMSNFGQIGKDMIKGVWEGIKSMGSWIGDKVGSFFSGLVGKAKKALGIHSPSRVFRDQVGKWIPAGVDVGIDREMPKLERNVENAFGDIVPSFDVSSYASLPVEKSSSSNVPTAFNFNLNIERVDGTSSSNIDALMEEMAFRMQQKAYAVGLIR